MPESSLNKRLSLLQRIKFNYLVRDIDVGNILETFFVSAVSSILIIRVVLHITGYPKISEGNFHIAHMLFGGFIMLLALILLLSFLNRNLKYLSAVLGGIGFGAFIDEFGKFITNDNNYFFQPTIALIYVIFILLFFLFRLIERISDFSKKEYAVNALEMTKEVILLDLDTEEKKKALLYLSKAESGDADVKALGKMLEEIRAFPAKKTFLNTARGALRNYYKGIVKNKRFRQFIIWFFAITSIAGFFPAAYDLFSIRRFAQWGLALSNALAAIYILIGILFIREGRRKAAYEMFKLAVLVSIFLTQFFAFFQHQLSAIIALFAYLFILSLLQYLITQEDIY